MAKDAGSLKDGAGVDDGGPAFPTARGRLGISLRDYFAAAALTGSISSAKYSQAAFSFANKEDITPYDFHAVWAYRQADAMIAARKFVPRKR